MTDLPLLRRSPSCDSMLTILLRSVSPGSFARIAIEESAGLSSIVGAEVPIVAFSVYSRGYHFADLFARRHPRLVLATTKPWIARISKIVLGRLVPSNRDRESYVPLVEMLRWALLGPRASGLIYCEDQFVGLAALLRRFFRGTTYVLFVAEIIASPSVGKQLRESSGRLTGWALSRVTQRFESLVIKRATALVYCSAKAKRALESAYPFCRDFESSIIYPGCNPSEGASQFDQRHTVYFLCVSKWDSGRNPKFALELARRVPIRIVLGGTWITQAAKSEFEQEVLKTASALVGSVDLQDDLDEDQLDALYAGAYAYIHWNPEGFGMGVLEAMARGVPAICTDEAGAGEIVESGRNGFLIQGVSANSFAEVILTMLSDMSLRERLSDGALRTSKNLSWMRHNETLFNYLSAVSSRQR